MHIPRIYMYTYKEAEDIEASTHIRRHIERDCAFTSEERFLFSSPFPGQTTIVSTYTRGTRHLFPFISACARKRERGRQKTAAREHSDDNRARAEIASKREREYNV